MNSPSQPPAWPRLRFADGWDATLFVCGIWTIAVTSTLLLAYRSRQFPYSDDWSLVAVLSGEQPLTFDWLWAPHGGHRIVLPKLISLVLYNSSVGYDFRAGALVNVTLLSALAFVLMLASRHVRGWTSYSDAFFPLALLNSGGGLLWNFHLQFVCSTVIASVVLLIIVRRGSCTTTLSSLGAGLCLTLLPLCGLNGLVLVPALALWLGYSAIHDRQLFTPALIMLSFAVASVLLSALVLVGYKSSAPELASPGPMDTLKTAVAFLSAGFGSPFFSGSLSRRPWWRLVIPGALIVAGVVIGANGLRTRDDRPRAVGFLLFIVAFVSMALAIGIGRGGRPWNNRDGHYGTAALPVLIWVYFVWDVYLSQSASRLIRMSLFALMCGVFANSTTSALAWSDSVRQAEAAIEKDIRAGVGPCELTDTHIRSFFYVDTAWARNLVVAGLRTLHRANAGSFRVLREDQPGVVCKWEFHGATIGAGPD